MLNLSLLTIKRWITVKMLEDKNFNMIEELKPTLSEKLKGPDTDSNFDKIPIKLPKNLKECEIDGQYWGASYISKRCKVRVNAVVEFFTLFSLILYLKNHISCAL